MRLEKELPFGINLSFSMPDCKFFYTVPLSCMCANGYLQTLEFRVGFLLITS